MDANFELSLKFVPLVLAEFRHNRMAQSPHENYFDFELLGCLKNAL